MPREARKSENLMVRVDRNSKGIISRAATLRGISASDYVRWVVLAQARRDVEESRTSTITLNPAEQLAFWKALEAPAELSPRQKDLASIMRGRR